MKWLGARRECRALFEQRYFCLKAKGKYLMYKIEDIAVKKPFIYFVGEMYYTIGYGVFSVITETEDLVEVYTRFRDSMRAVNISQGPISTYPIGDEVFDDLNFLLKRAKKCASNSTTPQTKVLEEVHRFSKGEQKDLLEQMNYCIAAYSFFYHKGCYR